MRPDVEQQDELDQRPSLPPGMLAVLAIGLIGCILFGIRGCHQPPAAPPPVAAPVAPTETNAPPAPVVAPAPPTATPEVNHTVNSLVEAQTAFDRYAQWVHKADFDAASNAFRTIEIKLPSPELQTNFWAHAIPPGRSATLGLASLCLLCTDGQCWRCTGSGACTTCGGAGTCNTCQGKAARITRCAACRCATCAGVGRCATCAGQGLVKCAACNGTGSGSRAERVTCGICKGTGQHSGLQRANGASNQSKCFTCRGLGYRETSRYGTCTVCQGKGRTACGRCSGSGNCSACAGLGRSSTCTPCKSTGQVRIECPKCGGTGHCSDCKGTAKCTTCGGAGSCPKCAGNGIIRKMTLLVDSTWLTQTNGFIISDAKTGRRLASADTPGPHSATAMSRKLSFTLATNEVLWISTEPNVSRARELLLPP